MSWWVALIPAIAVLIQALPYLIGGYMGFELFKIILDNPVSLLSVIAGIMGAYLIYKKQLKYGMVLLIAGIIGYYLPLITNTTASIFTNPIVLIVASSLITIYYLASVKQLNKTTLKYMILGMVGAVLVTTLVSSVGDGGGPGPGFNYYEVTFECEIRRAIVPSVYPSKLEVIEIKPVSMCYSPSPLVIWPEEKEFELEVYKDGALIWKHRDKVSYGWLQTVASKNVTVCLRKGEYKVRLCTPESGEYIEKDVEVGIV